MVASIWTLLDPFVAYAGSRLTNAFFLFGFATNVAMALCEYAGFILPSSTPQTKGLAYAIEPAST
jgi:hypothetical protein